jgi:tol-pal system protein YbgF
MIAPRCQFIPVLCRRWAAPALAIGFITAAPLLAAAPVSAQSRDTQTLVNTIDRLERQLQALERTVYRGGAQPAGAAATTSVTGGTAPPAAVSQLQLKTSQLEEQMRGLTGRIEEMGFKINQINARLDRLVADVDFRLRALEGGGGQSNALSGATAPGGSQQFAPPVPPRPAPGPGDVVINQEGAPGPSRRFGTLTESQLRAANVNPSGVDAGSGSTTVQPGTQPAVASAGDVSGLPPGSAEDRYNYARGFLMRRDFEGAEQALQAFVNTYPENELAGNAQYWLGETYYVRNDFGTAARTFADGFQRYPDSTKAPDNLLKLGMSLAALERTEDACITLQKLANEYPQAAANIKRRAEDERSRLKCN